MTSEGVQPFSQAPWLCYPEFVTSRSWLRRALTAERLLGVKFDVKLILSTKTASYLEKVPKNHVPWVA